MVKIDIRLLTENDWLAWKEIRLLALSQQPEAFCAAYEEESQWDEHTFKQSLKDNDVFAVFSQDKIVGCVGFYVYHAIKMKHRGVMFSLYVNPENRGQNIGNQLVTHVLQHAKSKVLQLHCGVNTNNQGAIHLYQKHGFVIYGTVPCYLRIADKFYDLHDLVLKLN